MLIEKQLLKRYRIVRIIKEKSSYISYLARDEGLPGKPLCTLKELVSNTSNIRIKQSDLRDFFQNEAKILGKLGSSPYFTRLLDSFEKDGNLFIVHEYVSEVSLLENCKVEGTWEESRVISFLRYLLPALIYIHENGIIHRNIKPSNILIRSDTSQYPFVLIGFNIAAEYISSNSTDEYEATDKFAMGTPGYAPPEQMAMRSVYASDIYALGVTCIYLLTGRTPRELSYDPQTGELLWKEHVDISYSFGNILSRMLEISVRNRYSSAEQILEELSNFADVETESDITRHLTETEEVLYDLSSVEDFVNEASEFIVKAAIHIPKQKIRIGEEIEISVFASLEPVSSTESSDFYIDYCEIGILEIDTDTQLLEINIFLEAPGFEFISDNTSSLIFNANSLYHFKKSASSRETSFKLTALANGSSSIYGDVYIGTLFKRTLENKIEVGPLIGHEFRQPVRSFLSRPIPHVDLVLQISKHYELSEKSSSSFIFHYQVDGFHPISLFLEKDKYDSRPITANFVERALSLLKEKLRNGTISPYFKYSLISLGNYLYKSLIPTELQEVLNSICRLKTNLDILVLTNQYDYFPWEILHNGQYFLGERFVVGRWLLESNRTRPYEFPLGLVNLGYYAHVKQPVKWLEVLEVSEAPLPSLLSHGTIAELASIEPMRGLHLLRMGESEVCIEEHDDTPVLLENDESNRDLEEDVREIKLSLKRNRPLISLGYLNAGQAEWTNLTSTWASTFIRAGCSAFVGPLWAVQPQMEAAFVSTFYSRLWAGKPLGESFRAARQMARVAVPDSMDWLACVLFGDPMARPYRPVEGQGYAIVEPVGQDIDQPVMPGSRVRFRASLRRKPPIWYENRLMDVAETLEFDELKIYVVTSELQVEPGECIDMTKTPGGDYLGWFTLTVPVELTGRSALVQVHFEDGMEPIHSLRFAVQVADADGGAA